MPSVVTVLGPRQSGPGERHLMLTAAHEALDRIEAGEVTRIDVPSRGSGSSDDGTALRVELQPLIPALQSGSLFGDRSAVLVVDADQVLKGEAEVLADLVGAMDHDQVAAVFVASGSIPAPLGSTLQKAGETVRIAGLTERKAAQWLTEEARNRRLKLRGDAVSALISRFGSDVGALAQALDQLAASGEEITAEEVLSRFKNRPDEPTWHYVDAVVAGDVGDALRRLEDFLIHGHPLQVVAALSGDLRKRAMAAVAPDLATFADWVDSKPDYYPTKKTWDARSRATADDLARALDAVARTELNLKTMPEATHRLNLERLTVALCRWYGGARNR